MRSVVAVLNKSSFKLSGSMSISWLRKTEAKHSRHTQNSFLSSLDIGSATLIRNLKMRIKEGAFKNRNLQMMIMMLLFNNLSLTIINGNKKRASTKRDLQKIWSSNRVKWISFYKQSKRFVVSSKRWTTSCSKNYLFRKSRIRPKNYYGFCLISTRTI